MAVEYAEGDSIDLESETDTALAALQKVLQVMYKTIEVQYRNNSIDVQFNRGTAQYRV